MFGVNAWREKAVTMIFVGKPYSEIQTRRWPKLHCAVWEAERSQHPTSVVLGLCGSWMTRGGPLLDQMPATDSGGTR